MSQIICVGSASKDIFFPTEEGIFTNTPEDITSQKKVTFEVGAKYQVDDRFEAIGGVGANFAQGIARLGLDVAAYSCIGDDALGDWVVEELAKEGVATDLIERKEGAQTDLSAVLVFMEGGDRTIFFNRDSNEHLAVDAKKLADAEWIFVSALNGDWKKNLHTVVQGSLEYNIKLAVNPGQKNIQDDAQAVLKAVKHADVLLLNKDEAIVLVLGIHPNATHEELQNELFLIRELYVYGASVIGLTDGMAGAWGYAGGEILHSDALNQNAIDATGSGDAFGSGFLSAWIQHKGLEESLRWGVANGSSVVRFYGAREGLLRTDEIEAEALRVIITTVEEL